MTRAASVFDRPAVTQSRRVLESRGGTRSGRFDRSNVDLQALVGESVLESVSGFGGTLAATATRVVVVAPGGDRRPRAGLRAWPHGAVDARLELPRVGNGRVVLGTGPNPHAAVNLLVPAAFWPMAVRTVGRIRLEAKRARRAAFDARSARHRASSVSEDR